MRRETGARRGQKASGAAGSGAYPPLPRVQLDSLERVRREMARLYVEGKHGRRDGKSDPAGW